MVAVLSKNINIYAAEQFRESVFETDNNNVYLTIGHPVPWTDENTPNQANTSVATHYEFWRNMIGGKLVSGNDVRHVIPRFNWTSGNVYAAYHQCDCSLRAFDGNTQFYVVTSEWNVYKCLSNNTGAMSNSMPYQTEAGKTQTTADGYVWKYLYSIPPSDQLRFTTDQWIPVKTLTLDDNSLQWDVQQAAYNGGIEAIKMTNKGSGYLATSNVQVKVVGDGDQVELVPIINVASGMIDTLSVENPGIGYTFATVTITSNVGVGATADVIISPPGGHGSDPIHELGGSSIMINTRLKGSENSKLPVTNDYRQIALVKDPYLYKSNTISSNTAISQLTILNLNGASVDYVQDEVVYQGTTLQNANFTARVVRWEVATLQLYVSNCIGTIRSDTITGVTSRANWFVNNITYPDLEPYSGKLLYIDNIKAISRSSDQTEDFKVVIKF